MSDFNASDRDVDRAIRSWLHEDRHEDASRVAGAVLDRLDTTHQRRSWWPAWRFADMNGYAKLLIAAAAVVVVAVLGISLLSQRRERTRQRPAVAVAEPDATTDRAGVGSSVLWRDRSGDLPDARDSSIPDHDAIGLGCRGGVHQEASRPTR